MTTGHTVLNSYGQVLTDENKIEKLASGILQIERTKHTYDEFGRLTTTESLANILDDNQLHPVSKKTFEYESIAIDSAGAALTRFTGSSAEEAAQVALFADHEARAELSCCQETVCWLSGNLSIGRELFSGTQQPGWLSASPLRRLRASSWHSILPLRLYPTHSAVGSERQPILVDIRSCVPSSLHIAANPKELGFLRG